MADRPRPSPPHPARHGKPAPPAPYRTTDHLGDPQATGAPPGLAAKAKATVRDLFNDEGSIMPAAGATGPTLIFVIAVMAYLASLAFGATVTVNRLAADWSAQITSAVTVQIKPSRKIEASDQLDAVMAALNGTPGVEKAQPISRQSAVALLEPWLGAGNIAPDLPLPQLIDVTLDPDTPVDLADLARRIAAATPGATLDTHRQWQGELTVAARSAQWLSLTVLALIVGTMVAIVAFATNAGLSANHDVVEVLHLIGAQDLFIARQVQRHFLRLGLEGGALGFALSAMTFLLIGWLGGGDETFFLPLPTLKAIDYPLLLAVPLIAAIVTMATARITVLRALGRLP